ncbi:MAG: hypothetical protein QXW84_03225 [Archaeoglobaceae archaeon]
MLRIDAPKVITLIAIIILTSTLFLPVMSIEFRQMTLLDFAMNPYLGLAVFLAFLSAILGLYKARFNLIAGSLLLCFFLFLSFSKMRSPEYLAGYWLLLMSSFLFFGAYLLRKLQRKAY